MGEIKLELTTFPVALELAEPFEIATARWETADNVFVEVRAGEVTGAGEASPDDRSGESVESVCADLAAVDLTRLEGPLDLESAQGLLPPGSARCALDIALHDLAARTLGISVSALLGLRTDGLPPTSVTLPIDSPDRMVERARRFSDHPVLKMKVGFDGDVDAVGAVRDVYTGALRIDANEGWERDDAIERLRAMERFEVELCEQPVRRDRRDDLAAVTRATSIPIYADEDVRTAGDVVALAGVVDGVNLKLRKCGGIREAVKAIAVARAAGLGVMLGCDLTSGVCATAEARVAALVDHVDVDGPLLLARDPYPGVAYDRGRMTLPDGPGLGVAWSRP